MKFKDLFKKGLVGLLLFATISSSFVPQKVLASDNIVVDNVKAEVSFGDIVLRDPTVEEQKLINEGKIEQIEVDNLEMYIDKMEKGTIDITNNVIDVQLPQGRALSDVGKRTIGVNPIPVPPVWINCQFTYTSRKNASGQYYFTSVSNIKSWLTGIQFPINYSWSQKNSSYSFYNTNKSVKITVNGVIGTHIIVEGIGKVLEQNMSYSFDFDAR